MADVVTLEQSIDRCREMITHGSKSFSLASRLFPKKEREAAFMLYGWCRFCDDQIDEAVEQGKPELLSDRLGWLREETRNAFAGVPSNHAVFVAFSHLIKEYRIPEHYALELLEGMAMDVRNTRYETFDDLLVYCYRVAGVVGLMMSHVMGISSEDALRRACDLGLAMQLTNISRDILAYFSINYV